MRISIGSSRLKRSRFSNADRTPSAQRLKQGATFARIFFLIFALVGLAVLYPAGIQPAITMYESRSWPAHDCRVISSNVGSHRGSKGTTYSIDILYTYSVNGVEYQSRRYSGMNGSSSGYRGKQEVVSRYPAGLHFSCYVDPLNPTNALIEPGFTWMLALGLIPLSFFIFGLFGFLTVGSRFSTTQSIGTQTSAPSSTAFTTPIATTFNPDSQRGTSVMTAESSPLSRVFVVLLMSLFWNGIVSVFLYQAYSSFVHGRPEYFLVVFMVPFALIGLLLITLFFHSLVALLNPRITLEVTTLPWRLNERESISWSFKGNCSRITKLSFTLKGTEKVSYRSGKNRSTASHVFYSQLLKSVEQQFEIVQGNFSFQMPAQSMPSFSAQHNAIVWSIEVHGEIPRTADIKENFIIEVLPALLQQK